MDTKKLLMFVMSLPLAVRISWLHMRSNQGSKSATDKLVSLTPSPMP